PGASASTSGDGLTVTLDGAPDLSGVAVDGSHALYLADSTAGNRNFGRITAADNTAKTVTVASAFGVSLSGLSWAIGGQRASIGGTDSRKLFDNNSGNGDAMPGWVIELQNGHAETISSNIRMRRAGNQTDGPIILRGVKNAATRPVLTCDFDAVGLTLTHYCIARAFDLVNTNVTKSASVGFHADGGTVEDVGISDFWKGLRSSGVGVPFQALGCELVNITSHGMEISTGGARVLACRLKTIGGDGISASGNDYSGTLLISDCLITGVTGDGIRITATGTRSDRATGLLIERNTIEDCDGDGIEITATPANAVQVLRHGALLNNLLSNCGGYGVNFSGSGMTLAILDGLGFHICNNNTYNNTSGAYNPSLTAADYGDPQLDPQYVNAAGDDYGIGTNLKALGFPDGNLGRSGSTRSYVDIGAAQREEAGGGGSIFASPVIS
ncbi:MAG: right-handed parallel beta-helix repeat-containing protein, partial [Actinomycetota bacterium]